MSLSVNDIAIFLSIFGPAVFLVTALFTISDLNKRHKKEEKRETEKSDNTSTSRRVEFTSDLTIRKFTKIQP